MSTALPNCRLSIGHAAYWRLLGKLLIESLLGMPLIACYLLNVVRLHLEANISIKICKHLQGLGIICNIKVCSDGNVEFQCRENR